MTDFSAPTPTIERDRFGRPYVLPPGGDKPVPYTRCTTYIGGIDDKYKLGMWQQRHVARGIALYPELASAVRDTDPENKSALDDLVERAKDRVGAGDAARHGTYLHSVTEYADRGWDPAAVPPPIQSYGALDPGSYVPDLAAYLEATADLTSLYIEQFCVQDPFKVAGTPDRIVKYQGKRYMADLKTGNIELGVVGIAAQIAMYARSQPYDPETHTRLGHHNAELDRGIIIHLPAGTGTCRLYWIDLLKGWEAVLTNRDIRAKRQFRFKALTREFHPLPVAPLSLADQIKLTGTPEETRALWGANVAEWTPDLTELAKRHVAALQAQHQPPTGGFTHVQQQPVL